MTKKKERHFFDYFTSLLLALTGTAATAFYLPLSFDLPINKALVFGVAAAGCVIFTALFSLRRGKVPLGLAFGAAFLFAVYRCREMLFSDLESMLTRVADAYLQTFSWLSGSVHYSPTDCTIIFVFLAVFLAFFVSYSIVAARSSALAFICTFPIFFFCISASEDPPRLVLFALLLFWVVLVMIGGVRRSNERAGSRLVFYSIPAAALLLLIPALLLPTDNREFEKPDWSLDVYFKIEDLLGLGTDDPVTSLFTSAGFSYGELDLTNQGERRYNGSVMLTVSSTCAGRVYLRGYSLGDYTGTVWEADDSTEPSLGLFSAYQTAIDARGELPYSDGYITVTHAADNSGLMYLPYFMSGSNIGRMIGDSAANSSMLSSVFETGYINEAGSAVFTDFETYANEYASFEFSLEAVDYFGNGGNFGDEYDRYVLNTYLDLPDDTSTALFNMAYGAGLFSKTESTSISMEYYETALWVMDYISNAARYDLNTARSPEDQDFVLHFLNEAKQGYCVHFASAATAMLRALGVPARYVEGYAVTLAQANTETNVYDYNAHAWVEVYIPGFGWVPFEATPAAALPDAAESAQVSERPTQSNAATPAPETSPEPTPVPDDTGTGQPGAAKSLLWLLLIPTAILAVFARRRIILAMRRRRLSSENGGRTAIELWLRLQKLSRYGFTPPEYAKEIALKARFSTHDISDEEIARLRSCLEAETSSIYESLTPVKRLTFKYLFVIDAVT